MLEGLGRTSHQTFQCSIYEVIKQDDDLHESDSHDCLNINNFKYKMDHKTQSATHFSSLGLFGCFQQSIKGRDHCLLFTLGVLQANLRGGGGCLGNL